MKRLTIGFQVRASIARRVYESASAFGAALLALVLALGPAGGAGEAAALSDAPSPEPARIELPPLSAHELDNGLTVYVMERPQIPVVETTLAVPAGSLYDPNDAPGLAGLTARLTRGGTKSHTADELSAEFDQLGASVGTSAGLETAQINVAALSEHLERIFELTAEMAIHPTMPESEFSLRREEMLAGVKQQADLPALLADMHARAFYYGEEHRLGLVPSEQSVQRMSVEDVRAFYDAHWHPEGSSLFVIGDVDTEQAVQLAETYFGEWGEAPGGAGAAVSRADGGEPHAGGAAGDPPTPEPLTLDRSRIRFVEKPGMTQVQVRLTRPGLTIEDERRLPAQVANYILGGGGFASRLMKEIRSDSGQTYGISSRLDSFTFDGTWSISTFTRSEELFDTLSGIERVLRSFKEGGVTEDEVRAAKGQIIGSYPMGYETLSGLASQVRDATLRGRDMDYLAARAFDYEAVTRGEVNAAIDELLRPSTWSIVLVGDPNVLEDAPETIFGVSTGDVERVSWTEPVSGYKGAE